MTEPQSPSDERRPVWQQRLLDRIQDLSAQRGRLLRHGYNLPPGAGDLPLLAWRTHLLQLAADRAEVETHARAIGIPQPDIASARAIGARGWHADTKPEPGADVVREHMVAGIAGDVWQIQHMAVLDVARRMGRVSGTTHFEPSPRMVAQFERNLGALWMRAGNTVDAIGLTHEESTGMWATTDSEWRRILDATAHTYDSEALEERWRVYASPAIETSVVRDAAAIPLRLDVALSEQPVRIPAPHAMKTAAAAALLSQPHAGIDTIAEAVDRALPAEADYTRWDAPARTDAPQPPGRDLDAGTQL